MSLKYAVLGLLNIKDMTGYSLKKNFEGPMGAFWSVSYGGLYPALHKLVNEELIEVNELEDARNQKVYSITKKGREELGNWFFQPTAPLRAKDEYMLKIFLSNDLSTNDRIQLLSEYRQTKIHLLKVIKDLVSRRDSGEIIYLPVFDMVTKYSYRILENEINVLQELIDDEKMKETEENSDGKNQN